MLIMQYVLSIVFLWMFGNIYGKEKRFEVIVNLGESMKI